MKKPKTINPKLIQATRTALSNMVVERVRVMSKQTGLSVPFCARMIAHQMQLPGPPRLTYGGKA